MCRIKTGSRVAVKSIDARFTGPYWRPATVLGYRVHPHGVIHYCVRYANHIGGYDAMVTEHEVVRVRFE